MQEYNSRSESAISFEDISEFVYNSLRSLEGTNEQYEIYNVFNFQDLNTSFYYNSLETNDEDFLLESDDEKEASDNVLNHLYALLTLLQNKQNADIWLNLVHSNFRPLENMVENINKLKDYEIDPKNLNKMQCNT
ncbi:13418_t:CDS:2 [Racocetra fulgida]|uniref:13418_t:CDS:1 n=1 Tax=Racocetra fulgida TaxID=60492 RepID=A0A9N8ZGJ2_9GLOM|nr:13418_t:CDS:2 [Racocetra fulgida]